MVFYPAKFDVGKFDSSRFDELIKRYEHNSTTGAYGNTLYDDLWISQTFTNGIVETDELFSIKQVKIYVGKTGTSTGNLIVSIRAVDNDGKPTGSDLSSGSIAVSSISGTGWVTIDMTSAQLSQSTKYAIVLRAPDMDFPNIITAYAPNNTSTYSGGEYLSSTNGGSSWTAGDGRDLSFGVYGFPIDVNYTTKSSFSLVHKTHKRFEHYIEPKSFVSSWQYAVYGNNYHGQEFTIGSSADNQDIILRSVNLFLKRAGTQQGDLTLTLADSSKNTIAQATIASSGISTDSFIKYNIPISATKLLKSTKYFIYLSYGGNASNYIDVLFDDELQIYSGGQAFSSANAGSSWSAQGTDIFFEIFGTPYIEKTGNARIKIIKQNTDEGKSRIIVRKAFQKTSKSSINLAGKLTKTATSMIRVTKTKLPIGKSRIKKYLIITKEGKAELYLIKRITKATISRIKIIRQGTSTGKARVKKSYQITKQAISRIRATKTKQATANSMILTAGSKGISGKARIKVRKTFTKEGKSRIRITYQKQSTTNSKIVVPKRYSSSSTSMILVRGIRKESDTESRIKINYSLNKQSKTHIAVTYSTNRSGTAWIKVPIFMEKSGNASIAVQSLSVQKDGNASILTAHRHFVPADATILFSVKLNKGGVGRVKIPNYSFYGGNSRISIPLQKGTEAKSRIICLKQTSRESKTRVVYRADIEKQCLSRIRSKKTTEREGNASIAITRRTTRNGGSDLKVRKLTTRIGTSKVVYTMPVSYSGNSRIVIFPHKGGNASILVYKIQKTKTGNSRLITKLFKPKLHRIVRQKPKVLSVIPTKIKINRIYADKKIKKR